MIRNTRNLLLAIFIGVSTVPATEKTDIIVAQDGSGNFKTIQEALNSIPASNAQNITILVKNGTYIEHVIIEKSHLSIIGESREKTIIQFSINRDQWQLAHGNSTNGSGVIAIGVKTFDSVTIVPTTDIVIGNLTVENTYNSYGVKTHVIRSEGQSTRIWVIHCNVWCKGHDTIALWDKIDGMYYHTDCSFRGSIDAVCPRGWCYAVACEFYETASSAPIWHEGAVNTTQKFVIRTGVFKPAAGNTSYFKLLNGQLENKFYLLDAILSSKINKSGTYNAAYFYNCHGETANQDWFKDNLSSAPGSPTQEKITAKWVFDNQWDPEAAMPAVLPFAALPRPWNKAYGVSANAVLQWAATRNAEQYAVYFGKTNPPPFVKAQKENFFAPPPLAAGTYHWRVDAIRQTDTVKGAAWSFSVSQGAAAGYAGPDARQPEPLFTATLHDGTVLTFNYTVTASNVVTIRLVDLQGKEVFSLPGKAMNPGAYSESLRIRALPAGAYIARMQVGARRETARLSVP